jgi:hypothetical protein
MNATPNSNAPCSSGDRHRLPHRVPGLRPSLRLSARDLRGLVGMAAFMIAGCGRSGDEMADCKARAPAYQVGVYGCITQSSDVGNPPPPPSPLAAFHVEIFQSEPPPTPDDGLAPLIQTASDALGYYEIDLSSGNYSICTAFRRCSEFVVPAGARLALDYDFGLGPGWSPR